MHGSVHEKHSATPDNADRSVFKEDAAFALCLPHVDANHLGSVDHWMPQEEGPQCGARACQNADN
jgi:hypothetical protein